MLTPKLFISALSLLWCFGIWGQEPYNTKQVDSLLKKAYEMVTQGDYAPALQTHLQLYQWAKDRKDCEYESMIGLRLARNYFYIGTGREEFDLAIAQTEATLQTAQNCKMDSIERRSLYLLGAMYVQIEQPDSALYYFEQLEPLMNEAGAEETSRFYGVLSAFYLDPKMKDKASNLKKAFHYAKKGKELALVSRDESAIAFANMRMGAYYLGVNEDKQALLSYQQALKYSEKSDNVEGQVFALGAISRVFRKEGKTDELYETMLRRARLSDSLYSAKSAEKIAHYQTLYETEKKESALQATGLALQEQKERSFYIILIGVFLVAGLLVAGSFFYFKNKTRQKIALAVSKEKERNRIARELHDNVGSMVSFIVSKLDGIIYKMDENADKTPLDEVKSSAQQAMINLRETLWTLNNPNITNVELMDKLKVYIKRYSMIPSQISEETKGESELSSEVVLAIYRCVQEIINNVNKHSQADLVKVHFEANAEYFSVRIQDNGVGFEEQEKAESYGLKNIRARMDEIGASVNIYSQLQKGTVVEIVYPKH